MLKLDEEYKLKVAKECTFLAIQHGLIKESGNAESTARSVTNFYQCIFDNLDSKATSK